MQVSITFDLNENRAKLQKQLNTWNTLLAGGDNMMPVSEEEEAEETAPAKKAGKKSKPAATVSEEEEEEFGTEGAVEEEELEEEEETEEEEEDALPWETVKAAINKYGNKKPDEMKAILLSFNFKSTKELMGNKNKWEPVYRKVMAKLKATKKAK